MAGNEVVITIRARTSVRAGFDAAKKEAELAGTDAGEQYTERFVNMVALRMRDRLHAPMNQIGQEVGQKMGEGTAKGIAQVVAKGIAQIPQQTQDETEQAGEQIGDRMGVSSGRTWLQRMRDHISNFATRVRGQSVKAGEDIGDDISRGIEDRMSRNTSVDNRSRSGGIPGGGNGSNSVDNEKDGNRFSRWLKAGLEAASGFVSGFGDKIASFFSGDMISMVVKAVAIGGLATALSSVVGAAITTGILLALGGGVLGAGIAAAFKDPRISGAAKELGDKINKMFEAFGKPFVPHIGIFLEKFSGFLDRISPKLKEVSERFAPIAGTMGEKFIEMLDNMMPGILEAVEASAPFLETLARHLPDLGKAIDKFFGAIAEGGPEANLFFSDLLSLIEKILPIAGKLIQTFTSMYSEVKLVAETGIFLFSLFGGAIATMVSIAKGNFNGFKNYVLDKLGQLLAGAGRALGWIPGIGPKLKRAEQEFNEFRKEANQELNKIKDRNVKVNIGLGSQLGLAALETAASLAGTLAARGYANGGIVGAAANGRTSSGLTWVGEHGPELAEIRPGGRVWSSPDSMRMAGQGQDGGQMSGTFRFEGSSDALWDAIGERIRVDVNRKGYGSVQATYGQGR